MLSYRYTLREGTFFHWICLLMPSSAPLEQALDLDHIQKTLSFNIFLIILASEHKGELTMNSSCLSQASRDKKK